MRKFYLSLFVLLCGYVSRSQVNTLSESFDAASPAGWTAVNNSSPVGTNSWSAGATTTLTGFVGAGYAVANYQAIAASSAGDISDWYISPQVNLKDGAIVKFYTRTAGGSTIYPDRLEVRLSTSGASTDVGTTTSSTGVFTITACTINPTLQAVAGSGGCGNPYPQTWTQYTITVSGVGSAPIAGRIAFRYWVTNGGETGANSNIIGIDEFSYDNTVCSGTPATGTSPADVTICSGGATSLGQSGISAASGISVQWQQGSAVGGPFTDVTTGTGGTTTSYTTPALTSTTYYRLKITCSNSGQIAYGNTVKVTVTTQPGSTPLNMGFNTTSSFNECLRVATVTSGGAHSAPALSFAVAATSVGSSSDPTLNPQEGDRMIRFNSYSCGQGDQSRLILPALNTTGIPNVDISYWLYELNGPLADADAVDVQYSTDGGTTWTTASGTTANITNASLASDGSQNRWVKKLFQLPAAVGNQANVLVGLLFTSGYGYNTFVDNLAVAARGTLPVTLFSFSGEKAGSINKLKWLTNTESNNSGFELQRSADGKQFSKISFVPSKAVNGNSNSTIDYSFADERPLNGANYYRLKQVDIDGKFVYSNIVVLKGDAKSFDISALYPNPAQDRVNLSLSSPRPLVASISITDVSGKTISKHTVMLVQGDNLIDLNTAALAPGNYFIRVVSNDEVKTARFVKN